MRSYTYILTCYVNEDHSIEILGLVLKMKILPLINDDFGATRCIPMLLNADGGQGYRGLPAENSERLVDHDQVRLVVSAPSNHNTANFY